MYNEALPYEVADAVASLILEYHILSQTPSSTTQSDCVALLEELIVMESLFPEIRLSDSPSLTLHHLMSHLGDGVFHSKYPYFHQTDTDNMALYSFIGDGPGVCIPASAALIDLYYIEGVLTKAHLRDGVWTDVLAYCRPLNIPVLWPAADKPNVRVTVALQVLRADSEELAALCYKGWTLSALKRLFPYVHTTTDASVSDEKIVFDLIAVDTSLVGADGLPNDVVAANWIVLGSPKHFDRYVDLADLRKSSGGGTTQSEAAVIYYHSISGKTAVGVLSRQCSITATITDISPVFTVFGHLDYVLELDPHTPGRTTYLPAFTRTLANLQIDSPTYEICDIVEFEYWNQYWFNAPKTTRTVLCDATPKHYCPTCGTNTIIQNYNYMCPNSECAGVVVARLSTLAKTCGLNLGLFANTEICKQIVSQSVLDNGPTTLAGVLVGLRGDIQRGRLRMPLCPDELVGALDEILEHIDDTLMYDYTQSQCLRFTRNILLALGFYHLMPATIDTIITAAQGRQQPPFPYVTDVLHDGKALITMGIKLPDVVGITAEAKRRASELTTLAIHYSPNYEPVLKQ